MKIVQWNCRGIHNKWSEFSNFMCKQDIACLQETWLKDGDIYLLTDFMVFRRDRPAGRLGGGTAIYCRKQFDPTSMQLPWLEDLGIEFSAILANGVCVGGKTLMILSIYKPPNLSLGKQKWKTFFIKLKDLDSEYSLLLCGDFNAQHSAWGASTTNAEGNAVADQLLMSDFICLNNDSWTRISTNENLFSVPDLTLCSITLSGSCTWCTLDEAMGSDHIPILVELKEEAENTSEPRAFHRPKLNTSNFNKHTFPSMVDSRMKTTNIPREKGSDMYDTWQDIVMDCCLKSGAHILNNLGQRISYDAELDARIVSTQQKKSKKSNITSNKPWWDRECEEAIIKRKKAYKRLKMNPSVETLENYSSVSQATRKTLWKRKKQNFKSFTNDINDNFSIGGFWESVKKLKNCPFNNPAKFTSPTKSHKSLYKGIGYKFYK